MLLDYKSIKQERDSNWIRQYGKFWRAKHIFVAVMKYKLKHLSTWLVQYFPYQVNLLLARVLTVILFITASFRNIIVLK